jgi:hypothetical protein
MKHLQNWSDVAMEYYKAVIKINPDFSQTLNNMGILYTMQGNVRSYLQVT